MKLEDVIAHKGSEVLTINAEATIEQLIALLNEHRVGAAVVSDDGVHVEGIISERDIVQGLAAEGGALMQQIVGHVMTREIYSALPGDDVEEVARTMTNHRIRHVPVVVDDKLQAIVSIGDIVKARIDQLTDERDQLIGYVQQ